MKKYFLILATVLFACISCSDKTEWKDPELVDLIKIAPEEATFQKEGGVSRTIVTSSGQWELSGKENYDWVEVSQTSGKDGAVVTFTIAENLDKDKTAEYTFTCGKAKAEYKIYSYAGKAPAVKLLTEEDCDLNEKAQKFAIEVESELNYRDLKCEIIGENTEWLKFAACLAGDDSENHAVFHFNVSALDGLNDRKAVIKISGEGLIPAEVNIIQFAKDVLYTTDEFFKCELEGGEIPVEVTGNVQYSINIQEGCDWIKHSKTEESFGKYKEIFSVEKLESGSRRAVITFTQTDNEEGTEPLKAEITFTQISTIIKWAAQMDKARMFPKWLSGDGIVEKPNAPQKFTLEVMFCADKFEVNKISTLMGIEGQFLLRFGDAGCPSNRLQLATAGGNTNIDFEFKTNRWYHIALVYDEQKVTVYCDGKVILKETEVVHTNIMPDWDYESGWNSPRSFWYGYSWDGTRDLKGKMTEMRIWTKSLTEEEINAPDHFYKVDPESEGLACYWKFTEGEGDIVTNKATGKDALKGQSLFGETTVKGEDPAFKGINWAEVALPEK